MGETAQRVYDFICNYIRINGFSPTLREVAVACGLVVSNVNYHLDMLESRNLITRQSRIARGISLIEKAE
jgi:SOS-response transcriptional repressor LexA